MSWHCKQCNLATNIDEDECRSCHQSWRKVWQPPKKRSASRQRSAGRQPKPEKKEKKEQKKPKGTEVDPQDFALFPQKVPWIPTTPQARLTSRQIEQAGEGDKELLETPPAPVLPPPPEKPEANQALTAEETQALKYLKGLGELGVALPEVLQQQMAQLQAREREPQQMLSHTHLNRLKKSQAQLQAVARKIAQVDADWKEFTQTVAARIQDHASWYRAHREDLVRQFNIKSDELTNIKAEVSVASQCLVGQINEPEAPAEACDPAADAQLLQGQLAQTGIPVIALDAADDEMQEEPEEANSPTSPGADKKNAKENRKVRLAAFGGIRSPTKVANAALKVKPER